MKFITIKAVLVSIIAIFVSVNANAAIVAGKIVRVVPLFEEHVINEQVCETIPQAAPMTQPAVNAGSVIGGIAGAMIGSKAGKGNGRLALTALGAVTGALAGDRLSQQRHHTQTQCRVIQRPYKRNLGYQVTYMVDGEVFTATMATDPSNGGAIDLLQVQLSPIHANVTGGF